MNGKEKDLSLLSKISQQSPLFVNTFVASFGGFTTYFTFV